MSFFWGGTHAECNQNECRGKRNRSGVHRVLVQACIKKIFKSVNFDLILYSTPPIRSRM